MAGRDGFGGQRPPPPPPPLIPHMANEERRLSEGKMAMVAALSLVDEAYDLGAVTDTRRQMLLQSIRSVQADLDRIERGLIEGHFHLS